MDNTYTIDLDLPKIILRCPGVTVVLWRVSASGKGWHLKWSCNIPACLDCSKIEYQYDDEQRYKRDTERKPHRRRVLWDSKGGRKAGIWHSVTRGNVTKGHVPRKD